MAEATTSKFDTKAFINTYAKSATQHRLKLLRVLAKKAWFQASSADIQHELATLPQKGKENHDGFLEALIRRKDDIGGVRTLRLLKLARTNYTLCPMFELLNLQTKAIYTYDYAAYRHGIPAGAKGLVLIRPDRDSEPTHMIVLSGEKFAIAERTYELIGGLPEVDLDERRDVIKGITREIREETGVKNLKIDEIKLLGNLVVDPGHTSHETQFFVAYLLEKDAAEVTSHAKNIDDFELTTYVHILPLSDMKKLVRKTSNALLLAAFAKALAAGLIPLHYCIDTLSQPPDDETPATPKLATN